MKIENISIAKDLLRTVLQYKGQLYFIKEESSEQNLVFTYGSIQYVLLLETCTVEELVDLVGYTETDYTKELTAKVRKALISYNQSTEPSPLRKVKFNRWIPREVEFTGTSNLRGTKPGTNCFEKDYPNEGLFHGWGVNYNEFETGPGNYSTAIVELPDGRVEEVLPSNIKFVS